MDRITKKQRSYTMSRIRSKNTTPEKIMFDELKKLGIRFKRHYKLLGSPDIAFPKEKIAVFIDGDFWHGKEYEKRKLTLPDYWVKKIKRNIERDKEYRSKLKKEGWRIIRLWEKTVLEKPNACTDKILAGLYKTAKQKGGFGN